MMKRIFYYRRYCVSAPKTLERRKDKLDFSQLNNKSKVPDEPVKSTLSAGSEKEIEIDQKTVQLLERLSLVNLDGDEALKTLKSSIQFAQKIERIDTENIKPLYTVLEDQPIELRIDLVDEGDCREEILKNAKVVEEDYFISPPGNIPLKQ